MILCVFNFGYSDSEQGSGVVNLIPYTAYFKSNREMTNWFRSQMQDVYDIAVEGSFPKKSMCLFVKVIIDYGDQYYQKEFSIKCKKIREYNIIVRKNQKNY